MSTPRQQSTASGSNRAAGSQPPTGNTAQKERVVPLGPYMLMKPKIGSGSYADVYKGYRKDTGEMVAIKVIAKEKLNHKLQESLKQEIGYLKSINHPNIVKLHDIMEKQGKNQKNYMILILEYCEGGDLSQFIRKRGPLNEKLIRQFVLDIARGLECLNARNIVHRDLKPHNLLLTYTSNTSSRNINSINNNRPASLMDEDIQIKIADFGFAREIEPSDMAATLCGSPLYMAPEILKNEKYDAKVDLWSVGTIIYEMLTTKPPFNGADRMDLLRNIENATFINLPPNISPYLGDLITNLLQKYPHLRINHTQFLSHPYISQNVLHVENSVGNTTDALSNTHSETNNHSNSNSVDATAKYRDSSGNSNTSTASSPKNTDASREVSSIADGNTETPSSLQQKGKEKDFPNRNADSGEIERDYVVIQQSDILTTSKMYAANRSNSNSINSNNSLYRNQLDVFDSTKFLSESGHFVYQPVIFDFSVLQCDANQVEDLNELESLAKISWIIAELAVIYRQRNQYEESFILYIKSVDILSKIYIKLKALVSDYNSTNNNAQNLERPKALLSWIRIHYDQFLSQAQNIKSQHITYFTNNGNNSPINKHNQYSIGYTSPEMLLYNYIIQLGNEGAVEECINNLTMSDVLYNRGVEVIRYLLSSNSNSSSSVLSPTDRLQLQIFLNGFEKRLDSIHQKIFSKSVK